MSVFSKPSMINRLIIALIRRLIDEHQEFMDGLSVRQPEIDSVCKPMRPKSAAPSSRRTSRIGSKQPG